ncbi:MULTISPECIES: DUF4181 domain-containing protein [Planococcus]|uniref:DUF4181 domain-containing protein n=1 Tax=Planococcus TaxID=1372 RepID=UPI00099045F3|nr:MULTISPECIES: DUF4181 domain-containing protein [Planococcus]MDJ0332259.1 DUF4181 domain-containing protein [Planococcus sp. S3-L1]
MIVEDVGWRIFLFLLGVVSSIFLVNMLLRKILGVERKAFFSDTRVNDVHKKWDRILNGLSAVIVFIISLVAINYGPAAFFYVLLVSVLLGIIQLLVRLGFEKKHAENPNDYLYTLLESVTGTIILITFGVSLFPDYLSVVFNI